MSEHEHRDAPVTARKRKFPPDPPWTLDHAKTEVLRAAAWADDMGFRNLAPRLEWAARIIEREAKMLPALPTIGDRHE